MSQKRDIDLPDYSAPPINEVVLGVQFTTPPGYGLLYSGHVWDLYKSKYPKFDVQPPLAPAFEIFGGSPHNPFFQNHFRIGPIANHDRFWFMTDDRSELLQFQQDRFMHNWRELPELKNKYPRFDNMVVSFQEELHSLNNFMAKIPPEQPLQINQCEVSYINHLPISNNKPDFWINLLSFGNTDPENLTFVLTEILTNEQGNPYARLVIEAFSGVKNHSGEPIISLNLTVRGAPRKPTIDASIEFLTNARKVIVNKFTDITTKAAHEIWERQQ